MDFVGFFCCLYSLVFLVCFSCVLEQEAQWLGITVPLMEVYRGNSQGHFTYILRRLVFAKGGCNELSSLWGSINNKSHQLSEKETFIVTLY